MNSRDEIETGARLAELHRSSWKQALGKLVSPAIRLHHYRTAHNRVLQAALSARDCPVFRECTADE